MGGKEKEERDIGEKGRVKRILDGGHVPMINTFDFDRIGASRFVNMFNLYENAAIDQIIDRVARTNSASRVEQTAFKYTPAPSSRYRLVSCVFKLARMISQRSRGYRIKRFVAVCRVKQPRLAG